MNESELEELRGWKERTSEMLRAKRTALLAEVDAIEIMLQMPRTSDMRRQAKQTGFYDDNTNYTGEGTA